MKRAAASLKSKKQAVKIAKKPPPPKKKPAKKKKPTTKAKPKTRGKVVGRIAPKGKAKTPSRAVPMLGVRVPSGPVDPGDMVRTALSRAADIVLSEDRFSLHDAKQAIDIVRNALETIAVVESHRPPAQVEAEMSQFTQVALDFIPQKRREDFITAFEKALKAAT